MTLYYFAGIILVACFVQAVAGFGLPLIAMPVLIELYGIRAAAPLMALIILQLQILMIARYRSAWNRGTVLRISAAAVLGIPIGVLFLSQIPEAITVTLLGLILIFYALYSLFRLPVPRLAHTAWSYLCGFVGGMGGGAYNMAAPPMIIYGDTQRWPPQEFKGNLQGYFFIITAVTIVAHGLNQSLSSAILRNSLMAIPFVILGAFSGFYLDRYINAVTFRKIVLGLLLLLGISLVLTWLR
jgi:uncharacterized membrane protein YfcA